MSYLSNAVIGYEHLEPVILGNAALGRSMLLVGPPGSAKSTLVRLLAQTHAPEASSQQDFAIYDASLPDFTSYPCKIHDTPISDAQPQSHADSFGDKTLIAIEEVGRADKENKSAIRDMLRKKHFRGVPLSCRLLIATMDSDSYDVIVRGPSPLMTDFDCVVHLRKSDDIPTCDEIRRIMEVNLFCDETSTDTDAQQIFSDIRVCYRNIVQTDEHRKAVLTYTSRLLSHLLSPRTAYHSRGKKHISPKRFIALADQIMIIAAYYHSQDPSEDALERSAKMALQYGLAFPLGLDVAPLIMLHSKYKGVFDGSRDLFADVLDEMQDSKVESAIAEPLAEPDELPLLDATEEQIVPEPAPKRRRSSLFGLQKG